MYRSLFLIAVLSFASAHHGCHKHGHGLDDMHNHSFLELSADIIAFDRKIQNSCTRHSNGATREVIEADQYKLVVPMSDYAETDIEIKIKYKIIYINAKNKSTGKRYTEIRPIPSFVDISLAKYFLEDGELKILMPIKSEETKNCALTIDDKVITVPAMDLSGINSEISDRNSVV